MEAMLTGVDWLMGCMYSPKELRTPMVTIKIMAPAPTMSHKERLDCVLLDIVSPLSVLVLFFNKRPVNPIRAYCITDGLTAW